MKKTIFGKYNIEKRKGFVPIGPVLSQKLPFWKYSFAGIILSLAVIGLTLLLKNKLPPELPLLYGKPEGEEQLVSFSWITIPQFISIGVIIINSLIAFLINDLFLKRILVLFSLLVCLFSIITTFKIIFLVGSI